MSAETARGSARAMKRTRAATLAVMTATRGIRAGAPSFSDVTGRQGPGLRLFPAVVRGFLGDDHVVGVRVVETRGRGTDHLRFHAPGLDRGASGQAHAAADAARQLQDQSLDAPLVG